MQRHLGVQQECGSRLDLQKKKSCRRQHGSFPEPSLVVRAERKICIDSLWAKIHITNDLQRDDSIAAESTPCLPAGE